SSRLLLSCADSIVRRGRGAVSALRFDQEPRRTGLWRYPCARRPDRPKEPRTVEFNPDPPRPRTSTRDPAEISAKLQGWLRGRHAGARVSNLATPSSNGMSSETLL